MHSLYQGQSVAFLTQHGKEALVRAPLESALGCQLVHTDAYDTDLLGTFTREVARPGSQLDAARQKARIGMELVQARIGLASEGAFGPDPFGGFIPWNTEVLVWLDEQRHLEVRGMAQGPAMSQCREVRTSTELEAFAAQAGFPSHHLSLRPAGERVHGIRKGLKDLASLLEAFKACLAESSQGVVLAENDLRAFCNPTRQQLIVQATADLICKLGSTCPQCASPGFWVSQRKPGLPCRQCRRPTALPLSQTWLCPGCGHEDERPMNEGQRADPARCPFCNP